MFDFDDGLTVESYRIPWLIWIQILIFLLLIFLLWCFSVSTSDLFDDGNNNSNNIIISSSSVSPSAADAFSISCTFLNKGINRFHPNQVGESEIMKGEIATNTSRRILGEENTESEGFSANAITDFHPCNYFRLAKLAFLRCFGLDPTSDTSSSSQSRKER